MKKIILLTLICLFSLTSFSQSKGEFIDVMVQGGKTLIGTGDAINGIIMQDVYNEDNQAVVYEIKLTKKETADLFRDHQSKQNLILADKQQGEKGIGKVAARRKIIVKYHYFYNSVIIKSFTIMPNEWNN